MPLAPLNCHLCSNKAEVYVYSTLIAHYYEQHDARFCCQYCTRQFVTEVDRNRHVERYHISHADFRCIICEQTQTKRKSLDQHYRFEHRNWEELKCGNCGTVMANADARKAHIHYCSLTTGCQQETPDAQDSSPDGNSNRSNIPEAKSTGKQKTTSPRKSRNDPPDMKLFCLICAYRYRHEDFFHHMRQHFRSGRCNFPCADCTGGVITDLQRLERHSGCFEKEAVRFESNRARGKATYPICECGFCARDPQHLKMHYDQWRSKWHTRCWRREEGKRSDDNTYSNVHQSAPASSSKETPNYNYDQNYTPHSSARHESRGPDEYNFRYRQLPRPVDGRYSTPRYYHSESRNVTEIVPQPSPVDLQNCASTSDRIELPVSPGTAQEKENESNGVKAHQVDGATEEKVGTVSKVQETPKLEVVILANHKKEVEEEEANCSSVPSVRNNMNEVVTGRNGFDTGVSTASSTTAAAVDTAKKDKENGKRSGNGGGKKRLFDETTDSSIVDQHEAPAKQPRITQPAAKTTQPVSNASGSSSDDSEDDDEEPSAHVTAKSAKRFQAELAKHFESSDSDDGSASSDEEETESGRKNEPTNQPVAKNRVSAAVSGKRGPNAINVLRPLPKKMVPAATSNSGDGQRQDHMDRRSHHMEYFCELCNGAPSRHRSSIMRHLEQRHQVDKGICARFCKSREVPDEPVTDREKRSRLVTTASVQIGVGLPCLECKRWKKRVKALDKFMAQATKRFDQTKRVPMPEQNE